MSVQWVRLWTVPAGVIDVWDASSLGVTPLHGHLSPIATPELRYLAYSIFLFHLLQIAVICSQTWPCTRSQPIWLTNNVIL